MATNRSSSRPPSTTPAKSPATPTYWIFLPYWSDQKYGTAENGSADSAPCTRVFAAQSACSTAFAQCSTRSSRSKSGLYQRATSPTATTFSVPSANPVASQTTPSVTTSPEPSNHPVTGAAPTATTSTSQGNSEPPASTTPAMLSSPATTASTPTPRRTSTPCDRCSSAAHIPRSGPSERIIGAASASTTVTSRPRLGQAAATSPPIHPPPITTTCEAPARPSRRARL